MPDPPGAGAVFLNFSALGETFKIPLTTVGALGRPWGATPRTTEEGGGSILLFPDILVFQRFLAVVEFRDVHRFGV